MGRHKEQLATTLRARLDSLGALTKAKQLAAGCGSSIEAVETRSRMAEHSRARHMIMKYLVEELGLAYNHVARVFEVMPRTVHYAVGRRWHKPNRGQQ